MNRTMLNITEHAFNVLLCAGAVLVSRSVGLNIDPATLIAGVALYRAIEAGRS